MKIAIQDILLKLIFNIKKKCINFIMTYIFLPKRMEIEKIEKLVANLRNKKCYTHKKLKASIKSRISIEKSA